MMAIERAKVKLLRVLNQVRADQQALRKILRQEMFDDRKMRKIK